jgi:hypothetical protein
MAESTPVAPVATSIPSTAEIARAEKFVREQFVHDGEDAATVLAPGTVRRRALDGALAELKDKAKHPSTDWRRRYSLLLGLERVLSEEEPLLKDGTVLSAHQVDALSGTLTALLAEAQRAAGDGNGRAAAAASPELLASAAILGAENGGAQNESRDGDGDGDAARAQAVLEEEDDEEEDDGEDEDLDDEDLDDDEDDEDEDLEPVARAEPEDEEDEDELDDELDLPQEEEP